MFEGLNESSIVSHAERPITRRCGCMHAECSLFSDGNTSPTENIGPPKCRARTRKKGRRKKKEIVIVEAPNTQRRSARSSLRLSRNLSRAVSLSQLSPRVPFVTFAFPTTRKSRLRTTLVTLCHQLFRLLLAPAEISGSSSLSLSIFLSSVHMRRFEEIFVFSWIIFSVLKKVVFFFSFPLREEQKCNDEH